MLAEEPWQYTPKLTSLSASGIAPLRSPKCTGPDPWDCLQKDTTSGREVPSDCCIPCTATKNRKVHAKQGMPSNMLRLYRRYTCRANLQEDHPSAIQPHRKDLSVK